MGPGVCAQSLLWSYRQTLESLVKKPVRPFCETTRRINMRTEISENRSNLRVVVVCLILIHGIERGCLRQDEHEYACHLAAEIRLGFSSLAGIIRATGAEGAYKLLARFPVHRRWQRQVGSSVGRRGRRRAVRYCRHLLGLYCRRKSKRRQIDERKKSEPSKRLTCEAHGNPPLRRGLQIDVQTSYTIPYMNSNYVLPVTIVVAGALIAGAVFWAGKSNTPGNGGNTQTPTVRPYAAGQDHLLGNPNAKVIVIEYADLECPFCKDFHTTMHQIMDFYGAEGQVAWVYRPFPLAQLHSKAPREAEAAECAAAQGGDAAFFRYIDRVYEVTPGSNGLDLNQLPVIAQELGLNVEAFNQCLSSGTFSKKVADSYQEALAAGGEGTPYVLITVGGQLVPGGNLSGAQAYSDMRAIIDAVLTQAGTPAAPAAQ